MMSTSITEVAIDYNAGLVGVLAGILDDTEPGQDDVIIGDLNGDKITNSLDYVLMRRYLLNTGLNIVQKAADLNGDKIINSLDYVLLRRTLLNAN